MYIKESVATNYRNDVVYEAPAIILGDTPNDDGFCRAYTLRWYIPDNAGDDECPVEEHIDRTTPDEVEPYGGAGSQHWYKPVDDSIG